MVPFRKRNFLPSDLSGWKTHSYASMPGNNAKPFTTAAFFDHILHWRSLLLVPASPKCCIWKRLPHTILRQSYIVLVIIQRLSSQNASKNEFLVNSFWRCLAARIQIAANPGRALCMLKNIHKLSPLRKRAASAEYADIWRHRTNHATIRQ